jgi:two-component system CheB/CheR fusion protein
VDNSELRLVVEQMAAAVTFCSRDLRYLWVSRRYAEWLGRTPEAIIGRPIRDVIGEAGWEGIRPYVEEVLAGRRVKYVDQVMFEGLGRRWIRAEYMPVERGWIAVVTDIDDQKRAELALEDANRRLREADRRRAQFLATLSHELRNPLAPIQTGLDLLEHAEAGSERARRAMQVLHRQTEHLTRLVDDLLDVTRFASGRVSLRREVIDLVALVEHAVEDHRGEFAKAGLVVDLNTADCPLTVNGDPTRLSQVMTNLLQNARKFTLHGGKITVSVMEDVASGVAVVRVIDTGRGIASEVLDHIFEPFVQADTSLDRQRGGLGLGLAIAKHVIDLHGGSIIAESDGVDKGATLTFRIPLVVSAATDAVARAGTNETRKSALRILIVEDNRDAAHALRDLLEAIGYRTQVAYTGLEGIEKALRDRPDVVVCDIGLPEMDGYEVARTIRSQLDHVKLIALTGYGMPEDQLKSKDAGFDAHLTKPAPLALLRRLLAASL